jgi:GNAT superfamily N-acetyltransferase
VPPPIEIRPVEDDAGAELSLALWNETVPERAATLDEVRAYREEVLGHLDAVAFLDGEPAGSAFVAIEPQHRHDEIAHAMVAVPPRFRRRGVGTALYGAVSAWAAERGRTTLEAWIHDSDPDGGDFAGKRGFTEASRDSRLALHLAEVEPEPVSPPPGIEIVTWAERPGLALGIYEVALECYPDIPGEEDVPVEPFEEWLAHDLGGPSDRPEATFLALAGDEVVGYAKFHLPGARARIALHDLTGVKRAWRGRSIAGALKRAQIAWAKAQGYERLETANELRNEPIRRLNERLGYREIPGRALVRGPLAPR